jgi:hypothetical protein
MTIILPGDIGSVSGGLPALPVSSAIPPGAGARDFGETLVRPIDAVQQAAELCLVDCSIHDATKAFEAFTRDLTVADGDFDAWPDRFTAAAKRVRDQFANRIPDGPSRDRFDAGFDLFTKAKAVETRGLATYRRIATNRAELDRALNGYGETISLAMNPVSVDFALTQGEAAIRNQVAAKVLSEDEGNALSQRYRTDIAFRRARQFMEDDPEEAARELQKNDGGLFADLDPAVRENLTAHADRAAVARKMDIARTRSAEELRGEAQIVVRRDAFLRDLDKRTENGTATLADIATAARDGVIDPTEADVRMQVLERNIADRERQAGRVAELMTRPDSFLNPDNQDDRRAADIHWTEMVEPLAAGLPADERASIEDAVVANTGILPKPLADKLRGGLLSGDPAMQVSAARRIDTWLLSQPLVPDGKNGLRIPEFETIRPYLDLQLTDARKAELAERDRGGIEFEKLPVRSEPFTAPNGEVRIENPDADGTASAEVVSGEAASIIDPERQQELENRLSDTKTRDALRAQLLKDLDAEAERSGLSPSEVLKRQQKIREALPAGPQNESQIAAVPALLVGGASIAPEALASALTAIGLGGMLLSLSGDTNNAVIATQDSILKSTNDGDDHGGRGRSRSEDESAQGGASAGDSGEDPDEDPSENRRRGRKARDSSKNERHGDGSRALGKAQKRMNAIDEEIRSAPNSKTKKRLKMKKKKVGKTANQKRRGTEHTRRDKR